MQVNSTTKPGHKAEAHHASCDVAECLHRMQEKGIWRRGQNRDMNAKTRSQLAAILRLRTPVTVQRNRPSQPKRRDSRELIDRAQDQDSMIASDASPPPGARD
jgi:hypothetical protein